MVAARARRRRPAGGKATAVIEDLDAGETRVVSVVIDDADERATDCDVTDVQRFST